MEEEDVLGPKDESRGACTNTIVKGKRTKRQRLQSTFLFEVSSNINNNNSDDQDEDCDSGGDHGGGLENDDGTKSSPESSLERIRDVDREEEDMAECLILLAQGQSRDLQKKADQHHHRPYDQRELFDQDDHKFNSKRYLEATTGAGKIGYYVYECKTCNRTFPSFQALGGHRASHKKPKVVVMEEKRQFISSPLLLDNDNEASPARFVRGGNGNISSALSLQLSSSRNSYGISGKYTSNSNPKVHECSICGAEFTSGQALGGHMRRHRTPMGATSGLSLHPLTPPDSEDPPARVKSIVSLDLDLNLPAPEPAGNKNVHEASNNKVSSVPTQPKQQGQQDQQPLMFTVPALVDCHY